MSLAITQPLDSASINLGFLRDYPVFVPPKPKPKPKPKPSLKLLLPSSLSTLKLDPGRLWLTRTPRKSQPDPNPPLPEQHFPPEDDEQLRVRTPVFTRPPVLEVEPPSPTLPTVPMPIKLPQLLSLSLTLVLPDPETVYNWADQPFVAFNPNGNVESVGSVMRARTANAAGREVGDARFVSLFSRSAPAPSRGIVEFEGWECEWNLMRLGRGEDDWRDEDEDEDEDEELDSGDSFGWPGFIFDEAYLGDTEDNWSDNEDETTFNQDGQCRGADVYGDCFVWLDAEISAGFEDGNSED